MRHILHPGWDTLEDVYYFVSLWNQFLAQTKSIQPIQRKQSFSGTAIKTGHPNTSVQ